MEGSALFDFVSLFIHYNGYMIVDYVSVGGVD